MSAEQCQVSHRNDRLKNQKDFWGIGNFYRYRLQILANLSGKHFGWNGATPFACTLMLADGTYHVLRRRQWALRTMSLRQWQASGGFGTHWQHEMASRARTRSLLTIGRGPRNGAFGKPCFCPRDTRHFRHFRRFTQRSV